jgi:aminodeoxyfutalosine deaminase
MFDTDLNAEYLLCHTQFGLDPSDLAQLARTGAHAAFCSEQRRRALLTEIDDVLSQQLGA